MPSPVLRQREHFPSPRQKPEKGPVCYSDMSEQLALAAMLGGTPEHVIRDASVDDRMPVLQLVVAGLGKSPRDDRESDRSEGKGECGVGHGRGDGNSRARLPSVKWLHNERLSSHCGVRV